MERWHKQHPTPHPTNPRRNFRRLRYAPAFRVAVGGGGGTHLDESIQRAVSESNVPALQHGHQRRHKLRPLRQPRRAHDGRHHRAGGVPQHLRRVPRRQQHPLADDGLRLGLQPLRSFFGLFLGGGWGIHSQGCFFSALGCLSVRLLVGDGGSRRCVLGLWTEALAWFISFFFLRAGLIFSVLV